MDRLSKRYIDTANWMRNTTDLHFMPINNIILPGTHDSGAYNIDLRIETDSEQYRIIEYLSRISSFVRSVVTDWSVTQQWSVYEQLVEGIRVFDFRVSVKDGRYYISHTFFCERLDTVLRDIGLFLSHHRGEVIIMCFKNDWADRHEMSPHTDRVTRIINRKLGSLLFPRGIIPTYNDMMLTDERAILFYEDADSAKYNFIWDNASLYNPWDNTDNIAEKLRMLEQNFNNMKPDQFNFVALTLTPQRSTVVRDVLGRIFLPWRSPSSVKEQAKQIHARFQQMIAENISQTYCLSCVKVDFPTEELICAIIGLN